MLGIFSIDGVDVNKLDVCRAARANTERCADIRFGSRMRMVVIGENRHSSLYLINTQIGIPARI